MTMLTNEGDDSGKQDAAITQADFEQIIQTIRIRDVRILEAESALRKMTEEYRKLREELLPVFRMAKDNTPLPYRPGESGNDPSPSFQSNIDQQPTTFPPQSKSFGSSLSRKLSTKKFTLGNTPKNASPTHLPPPHEDKSKGMNDRGPSSLDPSAAALAASSHLTASMSNLQQQPSPTSPPPQPPLASRSYNSRDGVGRTMGGGPRSSVMFNSDESTLTSNTSYQSMADRERGAIPNPPQSARRIPQPSNSLNDPPPSAGLSSRRNRDENDNTTEIFKSFRVSMDDPCHKVLPAALKKYNIQADWKQYALYIVFGDQERCLALDERPLILFKQLDREGKKPMFMLRKHATPGIEAYGGDPVPGSAGLVPGSARGVGQQSYTVPGGVL
jgi:protein STE50